MPNQSATRHAPEARGVYEAKHARRGQREFYAVTASGVAVLRLEREAGPDDDLTHVVAFLTDELNRLDPAADAAPSSARPHLRLS